VDGRRLVSLQRSLAIHRTWEPDPKRFPRGIKAVLRLRPFQGMKLVLWFEPERCAGNSC